FLLALILQYRFQKTTLALICLFGAAFLVRLCFAHLDPFLHPWDEKFHALVARNMMAAPLTPMLKPAAIYTKVPEAWCCNHIWLHKQPLLIRKTALSMQLYRISEFSIRYLRIQSCTLMILLLYHISLITINDQNFSFFAASLFCFSYFQLGVISGY